MTILAMRWMIRQTDLADTGSYGNPVYTNKRVLQMNVRDNKTNTDTWVDVPEVFVTEGGDEIPSGEKFTTKSLHDEPVISWKAND